MKHRRYGVLWLAGAVLAAMPAQGAPQPTGLDAPAAPSLLVQELEQGDAAFARKDYARAMQLYQLAAAQNNAHAEVKIAFLYATGSGVAREYAEAMQWYQKAAAQNDAEGQVGIGALYETGLGVPQDYGQAMQWYQKAAAQGDAEGQKAIAILYENGHGVPRDGA